MQGGPEGTPLRRIVRRDTPACSRADVSWSTMWLAWPGIPLHVQGGPTPRKTILRLFRDTPACAGRTACACVPCRRKTDYPCMCRVDPDRDSVDHDVEGLPLHMQGGRKRCRMDRRATGETPAYAGRTIGAWASTASRRDYPCICRGHPWSELIEGGLDRFALHMQGSSAWPIELRLCARSARSQRRQNGIGSLPSS